MFGAGRFSEDLFQLLSLKQYLCRVTTLIVEVLQIAPILCSGLTAEFCSHAVDSLEDVVLEAIRQQFDTFALTEHMPRDTLSDLYPEEVQRFIVEQNC
jgi:hypothetical protein